MSRHNTHHLSTRQAGVFTRFAKSAASATGHPATFGVALTVVAAWALTGPLFGFSDTWQLVINTGTTIVTFLMVFLIQNTQNRDSAAIQIKLDELIRANERTHTVLLDLEEMSDEEIIRLRKQYLALAARARKDLAKGESDMYSPEIKMS